MVEVYTRAAPWLQAVLALALLGQRGKGWYLSAPAGWSAALAGRGDVLFGVAYGLASVPCTVPVFLVVLVRRWPRGPVRCPWWCWPMRLG